MASPTPPSRRRSGLTAGVIYANSATAAVGVGLLAIFAIMAGLARMIADDYKYFARMRGVSVAAYVGEHLQIENGRYAQATLVAVGYRLFGEASVPVVIAFSVALLFAGCWVAARLMLPFRPPFTLTGPLTVALLGTALPIYTAKTLFDSYLWLTSMTVYVPPIGLALASVALTCRIIRTQGRVWAGPAWMAMALSWCGIIVTQGFNETTSLLVVGFYVLTLIVVIVRRRRQVIVYTAIACALAIGSLAAVLLAPAESARSEAFNTTDRLSRALAGLPAGLVTLRRFFGRGDMLLCVGAGLALVPLLAWATPRLVRWLIGLGLALMTVPFAVNVFIIHFAIGYEVLRTYTAVMAGVSWGIALVTAGITHLAIRLVATIDVVRSSRLSADAARLAVAVLATLCVAGGGAAQARTAFPLIQAESMRAQLLTVRDGVIRQAVADGSDTVTVIPAPLLSSPAGGVDFGYGDQLPPRWYLEGFRDYFELPAEVELVVDRNQPLGYCSAAWVWPSYETQTCSEQLENIRSGQIDPF